MYGAYFVHIVAGKLSSDLECYHYKYTIYLIMSALIFNNYGTIRLELNI